MGASLTRSRSAVVNDLVNKTFQEARNECSAECNQIISGNTIILDGSTAGDVQFTQRCTANAGCYMDNALEQIVTAFQTATAEAEATPPLLNFGISISEAEAYTTNNIKNEMTQVMENICQAEVNQAITDNIVFATDSTLGNIGFTQEGSAVANCVMENAGRMQAQMQQTGSATATAGLGLGGIIAIIILIVVIVMIIGIVKGAKKKDEEGADMEGMDSQNRAKSRRSAIPGRTSTSSRTSSGGKSKSNLFRSAVNSFSGSRK